MKISKIFHTLYGFLMCLPIISILFVCVYVSVNPNAKDSYYGETINQEIINTAEKYNVGIEYTFIKETSTTLTGLKFNPIFIEKISLTTNSAEIQQAWNNPLYTQIEVNNTSGRIIFYTDTGNSTYHTIGYTDIWEMKFKALTEKTITNNTGHITYITYNKYSFLDNAFYYSVNEINDNPLFSWAQNSFLVAPITYVVSLFGMTNNSPIVTMLSYWLTISIIWLVFDLIMYIPLLVHRWIDKGVVE